MDVVKLPPGERAPEDADCISLTRRADGRYTLTGAVLAGDESVSIVGGESYPSVERAESAGLAWADGYRVQRLFVATTEN